IFLWKDSCDNPFVTVTSSHLIAFRDLSLLGNIDAHQLIYSWRQFVTVLPGKHFDIDYDPVGTVWNTKRGITNFSRFFTKDGMQQALFRGKFSYAFWCNLTNENISSANFCTYADNAPLIQITQRLFTDVRNVTRNFFRSQFCITSFRFIFFNMNRSVD